MHPVQKMRGGDIAHVEGRILAQPDHVEVRQVHLGPVAEGDVAAFLAAQGDGAAARDHPAFVIAQLIDRVLEQAMAPRLGLQPDAERAVGVDRDILDRVHLQGDIQAHPVLLGRLGPLVARPPAGCKAADRLGGRIDLHALCPK